MGSEYKYIFAGARLSYRLIINKFGFSPQTELSLYLILCSLNSAAMKNILLTLMAVIIATAPSFNQTNEAPFSLVKKIADQNASALWGTVSSSDPIAYYSANDELIGYRFNFAIGKPILEIKNSSCLPLHHTLIL